MRHHHVLKYYHHLGEIAYLIVWNSTLKTWLKMITTKHGSSPCGDWILSSTLLIQVELTEIPETGVSGEQKEPRKDILYIFLSHLYLLPPHLLKF